MYAISCNQLDPYRDLITTFIKREFPILVKPHDAALLDLISEAVIASGQVRFGPKPSPESLVAIREIITHWQNADKPIPFLVAWGSEKPDGSGVDIAELFAFKTLSSLNDRVKKFYSPGIAINIRVEDVSAPHLFYENMEKARRDAAHYTSGFVKLARVAGVNGFVTVRPESSMIAEDTFNRTADDLLPAMTAHLNNPNDEDSKAYLLGRGWTNPLSQETLNWYLDRYAKLYPDKTPEQQRAILARYFAGALARYTLGIRGTNPDWQGKYLELSFTAPTPGIDATRALRRIYYRTMPSSITSNHMPPWRAKGYLRIGNDDISASLASFNTPQEYNPNTVTLSYAGESQEVQADYIIL